MVLQENIALYSSSNSATLVMEAEFSSKCR